MPANEAPEEELYRHGVSSGINFSRYEDIEVSMTGSDVLAKVNSFEEANLHSLVMRNIRKSNYSCPTPVQKHAIPNIKEGRSYCTALVSKGKTANPKGGRRRSYFKLPINSFIYSRC